MFSRPAAIITVFALSACGSADKGEEAAANMASVRPYLDAPTGSPPNLAAQAALANEAAAAEAADAAVGGTLNAADVSAANEQAAR